MERSKTPVKKVNPVTDTRRIGSKQFGVRSQEDQDRAIDSGNKYLYNVAAPIVTISTPYWYAVNLGSSGDTSYSCNLAVPDSTSSFAGYAAGNIATPCAGWVVGAFMELSAVRTAGAVAGRVIIGGDTYEFDEGLILDGNGPSNRYVSFFTPFSKEFPFAEDSQIRPGFITSGSFAPTTVDGRIWLVLRLDVE